MNAVTKAVSIAASVIITLALITLAVFEYREANTSVKSGIENMDDASMEWVNADLEDLEGKIVSGTELIQLARKYREEYAVAVDNVGDRVSATVTFDSSHPVVNTISADAQYIEPSALYECRLAYGTSEVRNVAATFDDAKHAKNVGLNVMGICFSKMKDSGSVSTYSSATAARWLSEKCGLGDGFDTLDDVAKYINSKELKGESEDWSTLKTVLGVSEDVSTKELLKLTIKTLEDQKSKLTESNEVTQTDDGFMTTLGRRGTESASQQITIAGAPSNYFVCAYQVSDGADRWECSTNGETWQNDSGEMVNSMVQVNRRGNEFFLKNQSDAPVKVVVMFR